VLKGTAPVLAGAAFSTRVLADAPPPEPVTPALIEAAKKEGQVIYYTSTDLPVAEKLAKAFEAKYPGICGPRRAHRRGARVPAHRPGIFQQHPRRRCREFVRCRAFHRLKRDGILAPYVPEDVAKFYPASTGIPMPVSRASASGSASSPTTPILVKADDAPKSFADLLDPKWKGKIVKAHPGYSGTIMTATYQMQRDLGWSFFEQLAKQNIMQVQSSADPPKKLDLGERGGDGRRQRVQYFPDEGGGPTGRAGPMPPKGRR